MVMHSTLGSLRRQCHTLVRLVLAVGAVFAVWYNRAVSHSVSLLPGIQKHNQESFIIAHTISESLDNQSHVVASEQNDNTVALVDDNRHGDAGKQQQAAASWNTSIPWPTGQVGHIADSHNRIVIFIASCPYLEMLDNVIESIKLANVTNYVVVPLDNITFHVASKLYPENAVSIPPFIRLQSSSEPATYGTKEFQALTASRPIILSAFLKLGYTIFYCDTDVVWKSSPISMLHENSDNHDLVAMIDNHINGEVCSCYLYLKPTPRSVDLLIRWNELIQTNRFQHDQAAFHTAYMQLRNDTRIKLFEPNNSYFPNGEFYFNRFSESQRSQVVMIHNNFIFGYHNKKERFIQHDLWHPSNAIQRMEYKC